MTSLINDVAIVAAPSDGLNLPDDNGIVRGDSAGMCFQVYAKGGLSEASANRTITVTFQGSNGVLVGGVLRWVNLSVGFDLTTGEETSSWSSIGATVLDALIDFEGYRFERIRLHYAFDAAPAVATPGALVASYTRE